MLYGGLSAPTICWLGSCSHSQEFNDFLFSKFPCEQYFLKELFPVSFVLWLNKKAVLLKVNVQYFLWKKGNLSVGAEEDYFVFCWTSSAFNYVFIAVWLPTHSFLYSVWVDRVNQHKNWMWFMTIQHFGNPLHRGKPGVHLYKSLQL